MDGGVISGVCNLRALDRNPRATEEAHHVAAQTTAKLVRRRCYSTWIDREHSACMPSFRFYMLM